MKLPNQSNTWGKQIEEFDDFLSRTGGVGKYAGSIEVAKRYLSICEKLLEERYKCEVNLNVEECQGTSDQRLLDKINNDTRLIEARMAQGIYAPNKQPILEIKQGSCRIDSLKSRLI